MLVEQDADPLVRCHFRSGDIGPMHRHQTIRPIGGAILQRQQHGLIRVLRPARHAMGQKTVIRIGPKRPVQRL